MIPKINAKELMSASKIDLKGKWAFATGTFLVFLIVSWGLQASVEKYPFTGIITVLIGGPIGVGLSNIALKIIRNEELHFEDSFVGFSNFVNSFLAYLLIVLFMVIGFSLLIIPGIIALIYLSMTYFIIAEDHSISAIEAVKKSYAMMQNHKMEYFSLLLRFFLLALLCLLTFGIGFIWLIPYMYVTNAKFYEIVKQEYASIGNV